MSRWTEKDGIDDQIGPDVKLTYRPNTIRMTWEKFYDEIFSEGVRYDPRYDRRVLWKKEKISKYVDGSARLVDLNPLILADVSVCYEFCESNPLMGTDRDYFDKILNEEYSVEAPSYLTRFTFKDIAFPITQGCRYLSMEAKNRIVSIMLVYLSDPKLYKNRELEFKMIGWDEDNQPNKKCGATRETLSLVYSYMAQTESQSDHMIRIGMLSKTGDSIYHIRNSFKNKKVKHITRGGNKKDKLIDLMTIGFTESAITKMKDDEFLLGQLVFLTEGNYGKNLSELCDNYYRYDKGEISEYKKVINLFKKFLINNYNIRYNLSSRKDWAIKLRTLYLIWMLCEWINGQDMKVLSKGWKQIVVKFFEWYKIYEDGSKSSKLIWKKYDKKTGDLKGEYSFTETLSYWQSEETAREHIIKLMVDELWEELILQKVITKQSPKKRATIKERILLWEEFSYARINGDLKIGEWFDGNEKNKLYKKITLLEALSCKYQVDHIDPQDNGGEHTLDNMEITTKEYNHWKLNRIPNYKKIKK